MSQRYLIETANTPEQLAEQVEKRLAEGWWLQGGVSAIFVERHDYKIEYAQALTRVEGNPVKKLEEFPVEQSVGAEVV